MLVKLFYRALEVLLTSTDILQNTKVWLAQENIQLFLFNFELFRTENLTFITRIQDQNQSVLASLFLQTPSLGTV